MKSNQFRHHGHGSIVRQVLAVGAAAVVWFLLQGTALAKGGVFGSPHNLSASGGRGEHGVAFAEETRVCAFCHVPHNARQPQLLWSRALPSEAIYTPYQSTTLKSSPAPDRPTGASRLCLSCHDGTIALGQFVGSRVSGSASMPADPLPTRNPNLSTDLSDDHPISFVYSETVAEQASLVPPGDLPAAIRLDRNGELQCTACHDPHDNQFGNFLVVDNRLPGSPLCTACHQPADWPAAAHNPQQNAVLTAGCLNCHYSHSAPEPMRLLHSPAEEDNCLGNCHNGLGDAALPDVRTVVQSALFRHPVDLTAGVHDPAEALPAERVHVECVDCHNPHQATSGDGKVARPPNVSGPLQGVRIDAAGTVAVNEFEICFNCHAGGRAGNFQGLSAPTPRRALLDPDQRNRFDAANPSYHPVTANRRGSGVSLRIELQTSMLRVYCGDCHNSDRSAKAGGSGADGPHGSNYPHILMAQYEMPTPTGPKLGYSASLYGLCFRCHEETFVMVSGSAFLKGGINQHDEHVRVREIPCFTCHDPHGPSLAAGATASGNAHLINFDLDYTSSPAVPLPQYRTLVPASGSCTVACHTNSNHTRSYP